MTLLAFLIIVGFVGSLFMSKQIIRLFLLALLFFAPFSYAQYEEIPIFNSYIVINKDASVDVTEYVSVFTHQDRILHGIVRRLPLRYKDNEGAMHNVNFQIQQVLMNNQPSTYHTEYSNHQLAIYIGDLYGMLAPGHYSYTIKYHLDGAIRFLKDSDKLYWNITGNEWDFPILKIEAHIFLPVGSQVLHYEGFTGKNGLKMQDFTIKQPYPNQILFITTKPLSAGESLRINVSWPKGIIVPPSFVKQMKTHFEIYRGPWIALVIVLVVLSYYGIVRLRRVRDDSPAG